MPRKSWRWYPRGQYAWEREDQGFTICKIIIGGKVTFELWRPPYERLAAFDSPDAAQAASHKHKPSKFRLTDKDPRK